MPPHRARALQEEAGLDATEEERQRLAWEELRKGINGLVNRVNVSNVADVVPRMLQLNLVRGRGLLARALMRAQLASPSFTNVYAAVVAVINTRLPAVGELLVQRVVLRLRKAYRRSDKVSTVALARFVAHLVNQGVAHELLALQLVTLLLEKPSDSSVEVASAFLKEAGAALTAEAPAAVDAVFERLRAILSEVGRGPAGAPPPPPPAEAAGGAEGDAAAVGAAPAAVSPRVRYTIESVMQARRTTPPFKAFPARVPELDLVEEDDQICHDVGLDDAIDPQPRLDGFRVDPDFDAGERVWEEARRAILGSDEEEEESDEQDGEGGGAEGGAEGADPADTEGATMVEGAEADRATAAAASSSSSSAAAPAEASSGILDYTEQDVVNLRRTLYLTIMNSLDFEECAHKIMRLDIPSGLESEVTNMLIECCSQEKTFKRFYSLLAARFCLVSPVYQDLLSEGFEKYLATIHRLELNRLRNVSRLFAHLFLADAVPWTAMAVIRISERETTSSSRIFLKILFQELASYLGIATLRERLLDPDMAETFEGMFPRSNLRDTRYSTNFFTEIGLGALTEESRKWLQEAPRIMAEQRAKAAAAAAARARSDSYDSYYDSYDSYYDSYDSYYDSYSESGSDSGSDSGGDKAGGTKKPKRRSKAARAKASPAAAAAAPAPAPAGRDTSPSPHRRDGGDASPGRPAEPAATARPAPAAARARLDSDSDGSASPRGGRRADDDLFARDRRSASPGLGPGRGARSRSRSPGAPRGRPGGRGPSPPPRRGERSPLGRDEDRAAARPAARDEDRAAARPAARDEDRAAARPAARSGDQWGRRRGGGEDWGPRQREREDGRRERSEDRPRGGRGSWEERDGAGDRPRGGRTSWDSRDGGRR